MPAVQAQATAFTPHLLSLDILSPFAPSILADAANLTFPEWILAAISLTCLFVIAMTADFVVDTFNPMRFSRMSMITAVGKYIRHEPLGP